MRSRRRGEEMIRKEIGVVKRRGGGSCQKTKHAGADLNELTSKKKLGLRGKRRNEWQESRSQKKVKSGRK